MTQEQLRMQMLAGIITEGQYKNMLNENKFEMIGSNIDELLDVISLINGGKEKSPFRDVARLKPLDTTGHQISDGKFSIEVELIPSGKVGEKLPNDSEYIQQINSFLEERGYQSKLKKYLAENKLLKEEISKVLKEEKSDLSNILFDISTLLDSLDNEQLQNTAKLSDADSKLLRKSVDNMLKSLSPVKYLIDTTQLSNE
jgi:hypothetical protein